MTMHDPTHAKALRSIISWARVMLDSIEGPPPNVEWRGHAQHEQRCASCRLWIFTNDDIVRVVPSLKYVHYECATHVIPEHDDSPEWTI